MKAKQNTKFKSYVNLYKSLYPQLSGVAHQYIKDVEECQEIVQEVFLDAWADYNEFDSENDKTIFFYEAVIDTCVSIKGKQKSKKLKCFKDLFKSLYPKLNAITYTYVKDFQVSKEVVQEVFLNAWADHSEFNDEDNIVFIFYDAVVNTCVAIIKENKTYDSIHNITTRPKVRVTEVMIINPTEVVDNILSNYLPKAEADAIKVSIEDY